MKKYLKREIVEIVYPCESKKGMFDRIYKFKVSIMNAENICLDDEKRQVHGFYITRGNKGMGEIVLEKGFSIETLRHEALHATIDFFIYLKVSFDEMFKEDDTNCGQEMFIHYFEEFIKEIGKKMGLKL